MKAKQLMWPGLLFVLIGAVVVLDVVMIVVASMSPPVIVEDAAPEAEAE